MASSLLPGSSLRGSLPGSSPEVQYGAQPPLIPTPHAVTCVFVWPCVPCAGPSPDTHPTQAPWGQGAQSNNPAPSPHPGGPPSPPAPHDPQQPPPEFTTKIKEWKRVWEWGAQHCG